MNAWDYILASLRYFRRLHLPVVAGVAVATAVITGALLVGSSMRGSLREIVEQRLGEIDTLVLAEQPFRQELAAETLQQPEVGNVYERAVPLMFARGSLSVRQDQTTRRANGLTLYGVTAEFWKLSQRPPSEGHREIGAREIYVTPEVAAELMVEEGQKALLRVPARSSIPADSTLGEKSGGFVSRRFTVRLASPADCPLYDFSIRPSQQPTRNCYLSLAALQDLLEQQDRVNAIAFESGSPRQTASDGSQLTQLLRPHLEDLGIRVTRHELPGSGRMVAQIAAERLVLPDATSTAIAQEFDKAGSQAVVTYLANSIRVGERKVPYSTVTGVDSIGTLGPLFDSQGQPIVIEPGEVVLNDWAAEKLDAQLGDEVEIHYYEPESSHGQLIEREPPLRLKLAAIVPLRDSEGELAAAADPLLTPELPGVTDQQSINDWDLPFELVEPIDQADEDYWDDHRTTPKAFIAHSLARRLWKTRWGAESLYRIPLASEADDPQTETLKAVRQRLNKVIDPAELGMQVLPVKRDARAAATGTTPFDGLFLGFSSFLMMAALLLIALLFRLGIEQRTAEVGLLLAIGSTARTVRGLLMREGLLVALLGAMIGVALGVVYARLMIYGLNHWWVAATVTPFMQLHLSAWSLLLGGLAGVLASAAAMAWTLRGLLKQPSTRLLGGQAQPPIEIKAATVRQKSWPLVGLALAAALGAYAWRSQGEAQAGAFFAGGICVLGAALAQTWRWLRSSGKAPAGTFSMNDLSLINTRRNAVRTVLTVGLAAAASFLLLALSAFRLQPSEGGTGGYDLLATAEVPLHYELTSEAGHEELALRSATKKGLGNAEVLACRVQQGEDASCLNLFQTSQPRILGVPTKITESNFQWGAAADHSEDESPWRLLDYELGNDGNQQAVIPVVLDRNTAFYSLKLYHLGARLTVADATGEDRTLEVVGMLTNSMLQGDLLMSEKNFLQLFPNTAGHQLFLIQSGSTAAQSGKQLAVQLETELEDYGFDVVSSQRRLASFMAVQNTYLSTFQTLGGLGLLLGVVGIAVVQLRSVVERRRELALMRAQGFRRQHLLRMVFLENLVLLLTGLGIGSLAAVAVVLPHALASQAGLPWLMLTGLLIAMGMAGAASGWLAIRSALATPLLPALRGE